MSNNFVTTIDLKLADKLLHDLKNQEFEISQPTYTIFHAKKKGISCTLYTSGKLMVQGKEMGPFIEFYLEPEVLGQCIYTYQDLNIITTGRIGIDESGKGDFFGPLCIAGVFAEGNEITKLKSIGVRDSKNLSDNSILKIGRQIEKEYQHQIVRINPLKYNELYSQFKNLNSLLAWGHATAIESLVQKTGCRNVIIDQFASENIVINALKRKKIDVSLEQRHRAEEDLVVAAASILARKAFLEGIDRLSKELEIPLPKGASSKTIAVGKELVLKYGKDILGKAGKLHFKTLHVILGDSG